jgi:hypothetical protein
MVWSCWGLGLEFIEGEGVGFRDWDVGVHRERGRLQKNRIQGSQWMCVCVCIISKIVSLDCVSVMCVYVCMVCGVMCGTHCPSQIPRKLVEQQHATHVRMHTHRK